MAKEGKKKGHKTKQRHTDQVYHFLWHTPPVSLCTSSSRVESTPPPFSLSLSFHVPLIFSLSGIIIGDGLFSGWGCAVRMQDGRGAVVFTAIIMFFFITIIIIISYGRWCLNFRMFGNWDINEGDVQTDEGWVSEMHERDQSRPRLPRGWLWRRQGGERGGVIQVTEERTHRALREAMEATDMISLWFIFFWGALIPCVFLSVYEAEAKKKTGGRERVCVCVCGCVERSSDDNNYRKDGRAHRGQTQQRSTWPVSLLFVLT